ncbi:MAG: hypothetical protein AAFX85_18900, partial [Pseudomonadota bacterium]
MIRATILLAGMLCGQLAGAFEPSTQIGEKLQAEVRSMTRAIETQDWDATLARTHPRILDAMGGLEAARETLNAQMSQIPKITYELLEFPASPTFHQGDGRWFAVIPTHSIISMSGQQVESWNYQMGILEEDAEDWTFLEGSRFPLVQEQWFPDFPG